MSLKDTGSTLAYLMPEGTIIGDCEVRQAKFHSAIEYVIVVRKRGVLNTLTSDKIYSLKNIYSTFKRNDKFLIIHSMMSYDSSSLGKLYELKVKVKDLGKGKTKVVELKIITSAPNGNGGRDYIAKQSTSCISEG